MFRTELRIAIWFLVLITGRLVAAEPAKPIADRLADRIFPSVFQAWNPADNLPDPDSLSGIARHDLFFHGPGFFHLDWNHRHEGLATGFTSESLPTARAMRQELLKQNPNQVILAEIRYRDAHQDYLPKNHRWWKRKDGERIVGWEEGGYFLLDFSNPDYRRQVARQARSAMESGVFDGVMVDWWMDDDDRLKLIQEIRSAIGEEALILVNANDRQTPRTAPYINGYYMECWRTQSDEDWKRVIDTLQFAEKTLRQPRINCVESWFHNSRDDLNLMRTTTTLALTLSDGFCLFSDPNDLPVPDHLHDWYAFWDYDLGRPTETGKRHEDGSYRRQFENGLAVSNPIGERSIRIQFAESRIRASTGETAKEFVLPARDGDLFLKELRRKPWATDD